MIRTKREWLLAGVAIAAAVMLAYVLIVVTPKEAQGEGGLLADLPGMKYEDQFITMDRAAVSEAYRAQIGHLFEVWMKDDSGQPARAVKGARQARKAFSDTMDSIERREREQRERKR